MKSVRACSKEAAQRRGRSVLQVNCSSKLVKTKNEVADLKSQILNGGKEGKANHRSFNTAGFEGNFFFFKAFLFKFWGFSCFTSGWFLRRKSAQWNGMTEFYRFGLFWLLVFLWVFLCGFAWCQTSSTLVSVCFLAVFCPCCFSYGFFYSSPLFGFPLPILYERFPSNFPSSTGSNKIISSTARTLMDEFQPDLISVAMGKRQIERLLHLLVRRYVESQVHLKERLEAKSSTYISSSAV